MEETVAAGWEAYARDVKPTEAEAERLREAFYSGAFAGHVLTLAACLSEDEEKLTALSDELGPKS